VRFIRHFSLERNLVTGCVRYATTSALAAQPNPCRIVERHPSRPARPACCASRTAAVNLLAASKSQKSRGRQQEL